MAPANNNYLDLLKEAESLVKNKITESDRPELKYHNLMHFEAVVRAAVKIAVYYELEDEHFFTVIIAVWFHDIGYYLGDAKGHEEAGAAYAAAFLKSKGVEQFVTDNVYNCIMATRLPQMPDNMLAQIVCDADLFHWGTDEFPMFNKMMRKEWEAVKDAKISKEEWRLSTIKLLESHHYQTGFCQELLTGKKQENIDALKAGKEEKEKEKEKEKDHKKDKNLVVPDGTELPDIVTKAKKKDDKPERGIETMFRISASNHQRLSDMADNKAHILITTTSIIISVLLSVLLRKLDDYPNLIIPTVLLLIVCVITMVFCILSTRPNIPDGRFTEEQVKNRKVNLLFFGNFYRMHYEEYEQGIFQVMEDRSFLYKSLTRDLYAQGIVLGKKYRLLRAGYNVFMFGVIVSVITFTVASLFFKANPGAAPLLHNVF